MIGRMRLRHELSYEASVGDVLTMLTDTAYWDLVAVATEAISSSATVEKAGEETIVVIDQQQQVTGVPSFAKKFVGDSTRAIKRQRWNGQASTFEVQTPGKPTQLVGTATLTEQGARTVLTYDLDIKASVPLVGGKLEKLVAELTTAGFDQEHVVGVAWLRGER